MVKVEKESYLAPSKSGSTQKMAANVKVVVRVRPMNGKELDKQSRLLVDVIDDRLLVFDPKEEFQQFFYQGVQQPHKGYLKRANKELKFVFDHVCDQEATNKYVFETTTKEMLCSLMEGYNCSVFAYGATGAGKTFTMIGNQEHPGITYLTMEHLFCTISSYEKDRDFDIGVSYIEVYNENVYDLIRPSKTPLQLREDPNYGVMVAGLTVSNIKTARELLNMLENGNKNRTQHPTDANAESSRSHAVFQVYIKMSYKTSSQVRVVKLSMIDLAGSERASATGCVGERFKEGANINKSLLSLANCINKLADGSSYIPYRDSKLTRLLKDSLGGNCKTVMIANVSPASSSYEDTYNTLKYAGRANKIQLSIKKTIVDGNMRLSNYVKINEELKKKVKELEAKLTMSSMTREGEQKLAQMTKMNEDLKKKFKDLETKFNTVKTESDSAKKKIKELEAKLTLSSLSIERKDDLIEEKVRREWRARIQQAAAAHWRLESGLLALQSRRRVLALRHRLRRGALAHVAELAHRSSTEAMEQMCNEDLPRHERAAEKYSEKAILLEIEVNAALVKWEDSYKNLEVLLDDAQSDNPELQDFIENIRLQSELREVKVRDELRLKLLVIENEEINAFTEYTSKMLNMLKKLYLTLKGYDRVTPSLTEEYLEIMKKIKSAKGISWSDANSETDSNFKFICNLTLDQPLRTKIKLSRKEDSNGTIDIVTDSDDLTDIENRDPVKMSGKKRKGTPIKLNNETIIINDSLDILDTTKPLNSAKKVKREFDTSCDVENDGRLQPKDLNSTFDMAGKIETYKTSLKSDVKTFSPHVKRELADRTNIMSRAPNTFYNDRVGQARIVKPVVGRAVAFRRPQASIAPVPKPGFGSSLSRDGTPLNRNIQDAMRAKGNGTQKSVGFKAVRSRERTQNHPYSRPAAPAARK